MDPFESLLKAAQQIDSPNFNVKVVVEMKQQQRSTTIRPTQLLSTPPRPSASSSAAAATMPPPPPPPRVQLAHHNPTVNSSVLAMPSLYPPYAAPAQYFNYYAAAAAAAAAQSSGSLLAPPTLATAAAMMTPPSSSSPSSSWPYYHLNPRFSGHSQEQFVVPPAPPAVGHLPHPATAAQPLCLFPSTTQAAAQASCQGLANPPPVSAAAAAAAAAATSAFRPFAERLVQGANNMTFVSPEPKKSRRVITAAAPAAAFSELKPSAQDDAPPEEEAAAAAAATTPATATTKMRLAVTPDAEVNNNNNNKDAADDDDDEEEEEEFDAIAWPVDENITLPALFDKEDKPFVNPTHYIIGSEILEPFVIPRYHDDAPPASAASTSFTSAHKKKNKQVKKRKKKINFRAGTIAFRCRFCKHSPNKNEAPLATIYPETVGGLYRANLRFQAGHLNKCEDCPAAVKERLENAQRSGDRRPYEVQVGVRRYWISTAVRKGFRNVTVKGKERLGFAPPVRQEY